MYNYIYLYIYTYMYYVLRTMYYVLRMTYYVLCIMRVHTCTYIHTDASDAHHIQAHMYVCPLCNVMQWNVDFGRTDNISVEVNAHLKVNDR